MSLKITPGSTRIISNQTLSCGNPNECQKTMAILDSVTSTVPLESIAIKKDGSWRVALERLRKFMDAEMPDTEVIDEFETALYFGSGFHVNIMLDRGWTRLGSFLGYDAGLLTHTLLPISEAGEYENTGHKIRLKGWVDLGGTGQPFYHLGVVTRINLTDDQIGAIKASQAASAPFMKALANLDGKTVETPDEYLAGIKHTARR